MNSWSFTGNLGQDAEQRYMPNGNAVLQFSVAVKAGYGDKAATTWVRCAMFGKSGEAVAPYLTKGQQVAVVGEASLREWEKDGAKRQSLEVRVVDLTLIGGRSTSDSGSAPQQRTEQQQRRPAPAQQQSSGSSQGGFGNFDDDIPFARLGAGGSWRCI